MNDYGSRSDRENPESKVPRLSVVVPAYNEAEVLPEFHNRLSKVLDRIGAEAEIVYVNDGSTDQTLTVLNKLLSNDPRVAVLDLSRNFGKEIALTAGIDAARGEAMVFIDADLQHPPEVIVDMVEKWREEDVDVVYAVRSRCDKENFLKKATARIFYRLIQRVGGRVHIPQDAGDFRLMNRRSVDALTQLRERHRFMKGLYAWVGFSQSFVPYNRDERFAGETKWSYFSLWTLAIEGFTSFTVAPLKIASFIGLVVAMLAFVYSIVIIYRTIVYGDPVAGYPSLIVTVLFLGATQLIALGMIGEYLGRIFNETKNRPLYLIKSYQNAEGTRLPARSSLGSGR